MEEYTPVKFQIVEHYATLSDENKLKPLELNKVSFGDYPAKYDLRRWSTNADGTKQPLKGVQITFAEFEALKEALANM